jgi:PBSX family phage terminase large subunit
MQEEFFHNANHRWNIKSGATRSGKTYMDYYVIPKRIRSRIGKDGLVAILGVSKGTIQRNIIEPLQNIWGTSLVGDINSQNICNMFGENVYCLGAEKINQVSKLRGSSIKYCYGDEVADWNKDVFDMLKSRLDKSYSCFDGACNPGAPQHWFKQFLDSDVDIYCQKYTIFDNPFLDSKFVEELCKEYKGTVLYDRYIRGLWVAAEGSIYKLMCDATSIESKHNPFILSEKPKNIMEINIGVDFGGSGSGHAFTATAYTRGYQSIVALASERHMSKNGSIDPDKLGQLFVDFCLKIINLYGYITHVYCDSAEQTLIAGLRTAARKGGVSWLRIENALKTTINDRIRFTQRMLSQQRFFYMQNQCKTLEDAMTTALWNEKNITEDERLDDGTSDIETLVSFEYTFERDISRFIRYE